MKIKTRIDIEKKICSVTTSGIDVEVMVIGIITVNGEDLVVCKESFTDTIWHDSSQEKYSELKSEVDERIRHCRLIAERVKSMLETLVMDGFKLNV